MFRDISLEEALTWLSDGKIESPQPPPAPSSSSNYQTLEIWRFLIDITYFDSADETKNRLQVIPVDVRKIRGALGFAEETLATQLVPYLVKNQTTAQDQYNTANKALKSVIDSWVQLDSWQPNFIDYWRTSSVAMPSRLREFLLEELGYVV
jgi:hypothetical protein